MRAPYESWLKRLDCEKMLGNITEILTRETVFILYNGPEHLDIDSGIPVHIGSMEDLLKAVNKIQDTTVVTCFVEAIPSHRKWEADSKKVLKGVFKDSHLFIPLKNKQQCMKIKPKSISSNLIPPGIGLTLHKKHDSSQELKLQRLTWRSVDSIGILCYQIAASLEGFKSVAMSCGSYDLFLTLKDRLSREYGLSICQNDYDLLRGYHPFEDCMEYVFAKGIPLINLLHEDFIEVVYV
jgi:hypothetical protein